MKNNEKEIIVKEEVQIGNIILEKGDKFKILEYDPPSLEQILGIADERTFNGCELAIIFAPLKKSTRTYKESTFIRVISFQPSVITLNPFKEEVSLSEMYLYGLVGVTKRNTFIRSNNDILDYPRYDNSYPFNLRSGNIYGEAKWDMDTDSVYFPYPDFYGLRYTVPKEIDDWLNKNFNNRFIEKSIGRKDY